MSYLSIGLSNQRRSFESLLGQKRQDFFLLILVSGAHYILTLELLVEAIPNRYSKEKNKTL